LQPLTQRKVLKKSGVSKQRELKFWKEIISLKNFKFHLVFKTKNCYLCTRFDSVITVKTTRNFERKFFENIGSRIKLGKYKMNNLVN